MAGNRGDAENLHDAVLTGETAMAFSDDLEQNVKTSLLEILGKKSLDDLSALKFGVAVSGGADSICLVTALKSVLPETASLFAITVNHNIRPREETCGDAAFAVDYCASIGVECFCAEIPEGRILEDARIDGTGVEDAARKARYNAFEKFICDKNIDFLCLAHNRNDRLETLMMRILQGTADLSGIPLSRGKFIRPLSGCDRSQIESYLRCRGISWKTDSTNGDNSYLRNRIRNVLVPLLNEEFSGWGKAVLSLSEKSAARTGALDFYREEARGRVEFDSSGRDRVSMNSGAFFSLPLETRTALMMDAVRHLGARDRIPYGFIKSRCLKEHAGIHPVERSSGLVFSCWEPFVSVEKETKVATETGFFCIIEESGKFCAGGFSFDVRMNDGAMVLSCDRDEVEIPGLKFPFAVRSRQGGDEIEAAGNRMRSLSKIFDDWKAGSLRDRILLVQQLVPDEDGSAPLRCIWGIPFGFRNWITGL